MRRTLRQISCRDVLAPEVRGCQRRDDGSACRTCVSTALSGPAACESRAADVSVPDGRSGNPCPPSSTGVLAAYGDRPRPGFALTSDRTDQGRVQGAPNGLARSCAFSESTWVGDLRGPSAHGDRPGSSGRKATFLSAPGFALTSDPNDQAASTRRAATDWPDRAPSANQPGGGPAHAFRGSTSDGERADQAASARRAAMYWPDRVPSANRTGGESDTYLRPADPRRVTGATFG